MKTSRKICSWLAVVVLGGGLAGGCGQKESEESKGEESSSGNPLSAPADYLGAVNQARKTSVGVVDTASLKKAIDLFSAEEGRYPKSLQELVTEGYLPAVPEAPRGMRYDYNPQTGQVRTVR